MMQIMVGRAMGAIGIGVLLGACGSPEQGTAATPSLDRATFEAKVQPILAAKCADPSCHGRPERALSIYAPMRWRMDPSRTYVQEPLTEAELEHDLVAAEVFAGPADPEGPLLARKALGAAGGLYHGGGAVFDGTTDPSYRAIVAWIGGSR